LSDVRSLLRLYRLFRAERPDIVMAGTRRRACSGPSPLAWLGVPVRVYSLLGLRLETARGLSRRVLWLTEWVATHAASGVVVVSPSLLRRARELRIFSHRRGVVLGRGASNGVDLDRFAVASGICGPGWASRAGRSCSASSAGVSPTRAYANWPPRSWR